MIVNTAKLSRPSYNYIHHILFFAKLIFFSKAISHLINFENHISISAKDRIILRYLNIIMTLYIQTVVLEQTVEAQIRPQGYKTFSMLNSVEHEILNAHKYKNIK